MKNRLPRLLIAVALAAPLTTGCAIHQSWAQNTTLVAPEAFVQGIYANYQKNPPRQAHGVDLNGAQGIALLDPKLYSLIKLDRNSPKGDVGLLDKDPICDCQDFEDIRPVTVMTKPSKETGHIYAVATFPNMGQNTTVAFDLIRSADSWRIFDISDASIPSLRRLLSHTPR